ncbi:MAG: hypothetical protein CMF49_08200 [Legionellales bacterium]|nr:hypothetical protein [Legionellales bacterium]|tara:strand:- start:28 stop:330 length:303 start_codon:yes stop_codon:yes gene_type:complete
MAEQESTIQSSLLDFTEAEESLIKASNTGQTAAISKARITAQLALTKEINRSSRAFIESNTKLIESQNKQSARMAYLTIALVIVGAVQAIGILIGVFWKG